MNDRICISSQGKINALYSAQKLISCCEDCGNGCNGGYTAAAWNYLKKRGIVTGGDYGSDEVIYCFLITLQLHINRFCAASIANKFYFPSRILTLILTESL